MVTHYFPHHGGGVELVAGHVAEHFVEQFGFQVIWYASACDAPPSGTEGLTCVSVPVCNSTEYRFGVPYPLWSPGALIGLWGETRRASVVYVHDFIYGGNLAACFFATIQRKPLLITQHIGFVPYRNGFLRGLLSTLNHTLGAWALGHADQVVFVSEAVREYFMRFVNFSYPPLVIPNGVDIARFHPADMETRANLRAKLGVEPEKSLLLFVGRFVEKKGLPILEELARHFTHCQWILVGRGPLDPVAWGLPNVRVLRDLPQDCLVPLYQAADMLVIPSKGEGFPLVVQEAMACGTPALVGFDSAAAFPLGPGMIYSADVEEPNAVSVWRARIEAILGDRQGLTDMRERVADFAHHTWSWKVCGKAYAEIINHLLTRLGKGQQ